MGRHGAPAGPRVEAPPSLATAPNGRHRHAAPSPTPTPAPRVVLPPPPPTAAPVPPAPAVDRALWETVAWSGFAVVVLWVVIVASGHGVASATAWAGSLFGLVLAAVAVLALTNRPQRTHPGSHAREG